MKHTKGDAMARTKLDNKLIDSLIAENCALKKELAELRNPIRSGRQIASELKALGAYKRYASDGLTGRGMYWNLDHKGQTYRLTKRAGEKLSESAVRLAMEIKGAKETP